MSVINFPLCPVVPGQLPIVELVDDVLVQIFKRYLKDNIGQFTTLVCVCKKWEAITWRQDFIDAFFEIQGMAIPRDRGLSWKDEYLVAVGDWFIDADPVVRTIDLPELEKKGNVVWIDAGFVHYFNNKLSIYLFSRMSDPIIIYTDSPITSVAQHENYLMWGMLDGNTVIYSLKSNEILFKYCLKPNSCPLAVFSFRKGFITVSERNVIYHNLKKSTYKSICAFDLPLPADSARGCNFFDGHLVFSAYGKNWVVNLLSNPPALSEIQLEQTVEFDRDGDEKEVFFEACGRAGKMARFQYSPYEDISSLTLLERHANTLGDTFTFQFDSARSIAKECRFIGDVLFDLSMIDDVHATHYLQVYALRGEDDYIWQTCFCQEIEDGVALRDDTWLWTVQDNKFIYINEEWTKLHIFTFPLPATESVRKKQRLDS